MIFKHLKIGPMKKEPHFVVKWRSGSHHRNFDSVYMRQRAGISFTNNCPNGSRWGSLGQTERNITLYTAASQNCSSLSLETNLARVILEAFGHHGLWAFKVTSNPKIPLLLSCTDKSANFQALYSK